MIGTLIKIDNCTIQTTHGRYVRLCILAPKGKSLPTEVLIGTHLQKILYEDTTPLSKFCGCLVHTQPSFPNNGATTATTPPSHNTSSTPTSPSQQGDESPWKTVNYPKTNRRSPLNNTQHSTPIT